MGFAGSLINLLVTVCMTEHTVEMESVCTNLPEEAAHCCVRKRSQGVFEHSFGGEKSVLIKFNTCK